MKRTVEAGLVAAAVAVAASFAVPALADGSGWGRGSIKEPVGSYSAAGPCYFRADVGYSFSNDPELRWSAWNPPLPYNERVTRKSMDDTWFGGVGTGCGSGSRGFRYEFMLDYHGQRSLSGTTAPFNDGLGNIQSARISSSLTSYTGMVNGYFDLGNWGGLVPYVGLGVGLAYHQMDDYALTGTSSTILWKVTGDNDLTLAWSAMAGFGYQLSDRAILDFGYRYIDLGRAASARNDNFSTTPSRLSVDDITAHEFKIGLRYHFGGDACCMAPGPLK